MMRDRLLKESDVLRAVDNRIKELSLDPQFIQKHGIIDVMGVKKHILAIPSADRPQGEWIVDKHKNIWDMGVDCYRCSNCGSRAINHSLIMDTTGLSYCPNCGARMKGADDE